MSTPDGPLPAPLAGMSLDLAGVKLWLRIDDTADDDVIQFCIDSTIDYVGQLPVVADRPPAVPSDPSTWPAGVLLGAIMLTGRRVRRRNSPGGVESFGDSVLYVARYDPEIESLLRLNAQKRPATDGPAPVVTPL